MQPLPPPSFILKHCLDLKVQQTIHLEHFTQSLTLYGYQKVDNVYEPGVCYSWLPSGFIPSGSTTAYRIELFDNQIDNIRSIDTETQKSIKPFSSIQLLPANEFTLKDNEIIPQKLSEHGISKTTPLQENYYQTNFLVE